MRVGEEVLGGKVVKEGLRGGAALLSVCKGRTIMVSETDKGITVSDKVSEL